MTIAYFSTIQLIFYPVADPMFSFWNRVSVTSDVCQSQMVGVVISQVYLSFRGVIGRGAGRREL